MERKLATGGHDGHVSPIVLFPFFWGVRLINGCRSDYGIQNLGAQLETR